MIGMSGRVTVTSSPGGPYREKKAWRVEETPCGLELRQTTIYQGAPGTPWYLDPACLQQDDRMDLFADTPDQAICASFVHFEKERARHERQVRRALNRCESLKALSLSPQARVPCLRVAV